MQLTRNFSLQELTKSDTAIRKGIDNEPNADQIDKLKTLCEKANCETDQLILEYYTPGEPNSGWIHASYIPFQPRAQYMRAYREDKKTKYKPITGKAVDLV